MTEQETRLTQDFLADWLRAVAFTREAVHRNKAEAVASGNAEHMTKRYGFRITAKEILEAAGV